MLHVAIAFRPDTTDPRAAALQRKLDAAGFETLRLARIDDVFWLDGGPDKGHDDVLAVVKDDVAQVEVNIEPAGNFVEVRPRPGVTDHAGEALADRLAAKWGARPQVTAGHRYHFEAIDDQTLERVGADILGNDVVELIKVGTATTNPFTRPPNADTTIDTFDLGAIDDHGLRMLSQSRRLALSLTEMRALRVHYRELGRPARDIELEMFAQSWSEHCAHKTFRALVDYEEVDATGQPIAGTADTIDGIMRTCLKEATKAADRDFVVSAFVDNAGIVRFDDELDVALKVETHNHPSALEPFGGANTGIGGVIRDILGVSARPMAVMDVLCFGSPDFPDDQLPKGSLPPRRVRDGVIHGIEDYGNKMGIPNVTGAVVYHDKYAGNPLVYAGCLGVLPRGAHPTAMTPGDRIVVVGGGTGRDGIGGATFSSMDLDDTVHDIAGSAVQIGHPIMERLVGELVVKARDEKLYSAITDCGAGGLSSAVGEMAEALGAEVELSSVHRKYSGLAPWEVWLSEAQERMVLAVDERNLGRVAELCDEVGVPFAVIGAFTDTGRLVLRSDGDVVAEVDLGFLHGGCPQAEMKARYHHRDDERLARFDFEIDTLSHDNVEEFALEAMASIHLTSREPLLRRYDHEVQGGTRMKPFGGRSGQTPRDGTVVIPQEAARAGRVRRGLAMGVGIDPRLGLFDPAKMTWATVDEAFRNVVCVGGDPDQVSLLDNFCWGNPTIEDRMGDLVRCAKACRDAAIAYRAPFISGKDSLYNEYRQEDGSQSAIPPTLLITALAVVPDATLSVGSECARDGDVVFLLGELDVSWQSEPRCYLDRYRAFHAAMKEGLITAAHDVSEGGLLLTLAEMCAYDGPGMQIDVAGLQAALTLSDERMWARLLWRANGSIVFATPPGTEARVSDLFAHEPLQRLGVVGPGGLQIKASSGSAAFDLDRVQRALQSSS